jgi:glycosyltransferase involved in cell wall biosynthesis
VYVAAVADELARRGIEVVVYTRRDDPDLPRRVVLASGAAVEHVEAGPPTRVARDALLPFMAEFGRQLAGSWASWRPDIVHAHYWMSGLASLRSAARLRIPLVQTFHALGTTKRRHLGAADTSPVERCSSEIRLASSVGAIVATSDAEVAELRASGAQPRRASVVPCGVDTSVFRPVGARPEPPAGRVLSVGRLIERKGVDDLIRSLPTLPDARLIVAGGGCGPGDGDATRLGRLAASLAVADRVDFVGPISRDRIPDLLRSADVVACVPWYEPFGMVALEAMACGIPVVVSAVGGLRSLVVHEKTGLHVPPRDPARIASAIRTLLDSADLRAQLGDSASRAAASYAWSFVADRLIEIYRSVAEGEGA